MSLRLKGSASGYVEIEAPAAAGSNTLTLPDGNGTANHSLVNDGSGNLSWFSGGPAFSAYQSTAHSLSAAVTTKLQYQTEDFDTANCYDNATNFRFTPNVAGYYQINASGYGIVASQTEMALYLFKNGSAARLLQNNITPASRQVAGSSIIYMNGTSDYLEVYLYISQAATSGISNTWFNAALIRPA